MNFFVRGFYNSEKVFLVILVLNITNFCPVSCVIPVLGSNLVMNDSPCLMEGLVIDYYGNDKIIRGKVEDVVKQKVNSISHPLGGNQSVVVKLEEIAIIQSNSAGWILEDKLHNFTLSEDIPGNAHVSNPGIDSISTGQFDSDAEEEIIIANPYGNVVIYDDYKQNYTEKARYTFTTPSATGDASLVWKECAIVAGNFDGNGTDEFAVAFTEYDWDDAYDLGYDPDNFDSQIDFYIFDPVENKERFHWYFYIDDAAEIADEGFGSGPWRSDHINHPLLKAGELDGDGREEIVLTTTGPAVYRGWVYEYDVRNNNFSQSYGWNSDLDSYYPVNYILDRHSSLYSYRDSNENIIALGDVDGDRRDEIIYLVRKSNNRIADYEASILILDDKINMYRELACLDIKSISGKSLIGGAMNSGDLDGDGFDEIAVFCLYPENTFGLIFDDIRSHFTINKTWEPEELSSIVGKELVLGDVDADGMDEIILSTGDNTPDYIETTWEGGYPSIPTYIFTVVGSGTHILDDAKHTYTLLYSDFNRKGFVSTGDFDADGVKLKYTGNHWSTKAPPKVIMVIAAPPTYRGISHNYAGSYTAFGTETSKGSVEGNSLSVSEGSYWSIGAELDITVLEIFSLEASFSFSKSITHEFGRTNTKTHTETIMTGYVVGTSDDAVIYQTTTFDNYEYEIVSHPINPASIGEHMTIDVPQMSIPWKVSRSYFNYKFSKAPKIGKETFSHTVGKPWTYPNISEIETIVPIRWTATQMQTVGQGDGVQSTKIEIENETGSQMSRAYTTGTSFDFEGTALFITAGGGWNSAKTDSSFTEVLIGEKMVYEGAIGDIKNNKTWEKLKFSFGLIVYNLEHSDGVTYQVINYYVENASVHEDLIQDLFVVIEDISNFFAWNPELSIAIGGTLTLSATALLLRKRRRGRAGRRRKKR
ncbi:MAG: hypothetical protein ACXABU_14855 [Candidatus Hodarchaeales archaeon]|jgi:hypothetical protein